MTRFSDEKKEMIEEMARESVYLAALEIFNEEGMEALTMDSLARRAGMAKGTIYNYFKNKDEVVRYVMTKILKPVGEKFLALDCERGDPKDIFAIMLDILTGIFSNPLELAALTEITERKEELEDLHRQPFSNMMRGRLNRIFHRGVEAGIFRDYSPVYVEEFIVSVLAGIGHRVSKNDFPDVGRGFSTFIKTVIIDGLSV